MEIESTPSRVSFLRARLPSIIAGGGGPSRVLLEVNDNPLAEEQESDNDQSQDGHLNVYLRIKRVPYDQNLYVIQNDTTLLCQEQNFTHGQMKNVLYKKIYKFTKIFGCESTQEDIFETVMRSKILHFINGLNSTILTYGASGSGKTYTIVGTAEKPGIIPATLEYLFSSLPKLSKEPHIKPLCNGKISQLNKMDIKNEQSRTQNILEMCSSSKNFLEHQQLYSSMHESLSNNLAAEVITNSSDLFLNVWVSFVEIYNECIYDLLDTKLKKKVRDNKLQLGHTNDGTVFIRDKKYINVRSGLEAYQILQYGIENLQRASTSVNDHSSRSHSIFTITLVQHCNEKNAYTVSSFNFCDLAGSERVKKTNNVGDRLKESNNINTSLLVLGRCINLVRENQNSNKNKLVPFRESKLTQIFQKALMGEEIISMIVNVNPITTMISESLHVLNFSAIAKDVALQEQKVVPRLCENRFTEYMGADDSVMNYSDRSDVSLILELEEELRELENEIEEQKVTSRQDREHIISTYKQLIKEAEEFWVARMEEEKQKRKLKKVEIISLDSSSEEESSDLDIQKQIQELRKQLEDKENDNTVLKNKNSSLKEVLKDATSSFANVKTHYEEETKKLCQQIVHQNELIHEKTCVYDDLQSKLAHKRENLCQINLCAESETIGQVQVKPECETDSCEDNASLAQDIRECDM